MTQRTATEFCLESPKTRKILTGLVHFGPFWVISPGDTRIQRDGLCLTTCFGKLTKSCLIGRKQFGGCTQNIVGCTECACDRLVAMMKASWQLMTGRSTDGSPTKHGKVFERQASQMYRPNKCSRTFNEPSYLEPGLMNCLFPVRRVSGPNFRRARHHYIFVTDLS